MCGSDGPAHSRAAANSRRGKGYGGLPRAGVVPIGDYVARSPLSSRSGSSNEFGLDLITWANDCWPTDTIHVFDYFVYPSPP